MPTQQYERMCDLIEKLEALSGHFYGMNEWHNGSVVISNLTHPTQRTPIRFENADAAELWLFREIFTLEKLQGA